MPVHVVRNCVFAMEIMRRYADITQIANTVAKKSIHHTINTMTSRMRP